jgi:hypothetical protein
MRAILGGLILLSSLSVFAQSQPTDLAIGLAVNSNQTRLLAQGGVLVIAKVTNRGPAAARNVVITLDVPGQIVGVTPPATVVCSGQQPIRCTLSLLPVGELLFPIYIATRIPVAGEYTAKAAISSTTAADSNPADNAASVPLSVAAASNLGVRIVNQFDWIPPGEARDVIVIVSNIGTLAAGQVRVAVTPLGGATIAAVTPLAGGPLTCAVADGAGVCTGTFAPSASASFTVKFEAPADGDGRIGFSVVATPADEDADAENNRLAAFYTVAREFIVTSTADAGAGSLRQAILDATSACAAVRCRISFQIPPPIPDAGWHTIHPESPLPPVSGMVGIDGRPRNGTFGPAIEIRGDRQREGNGIIIDDACEVEIRGLTINGFSVSAISIGKDTVCRPIGQRAAFPVFVGGNVIGLDPLGRTPVPNFRGIVGSAADSVGISDNLIGGNIRSGIFLGGGRVAHIRNNMIGLTRNEEPLPNGASGIYINTFSANISGNVIANNTDFGIAVSAFSPAIAMHHNRLFNNGHTAIDIGLDLETPNGDDAHRTALNRPKILSAHYDASIDRTIVRGRYDTDRSSGSTVVLEFFASSALNARGHAQAERVLGETKIVSGHTDFEFVAAGDLTGQWIAATATLWDFLTVIRDSTSELSDPIQVRP